MTGKEVELKTNLLSLPIEDWDEEARKAVKSRNIELLDDMDCLFVRFFCKNVAKQNFEELGRYNKLMINFLAWFEWGGKKEWDKAADIVDKWKILLELSKNIIETKSPLKAYKELKKSSYGEKLVELLYDKKILKPGEIKKELEIKSMQQVSTLLSKFERSGIITREIDGKNVWVSLGMQGIAVYQEYIEPQKNNDIILAIKKARQMYKNNELDKVEEEVLHLVEKAPHNSPMTCILGIIKLEKGNLHEAGKLFARTIKIGIKKENVFSFFAVLESVQRFQPFVNNLYKMYTQRDQIIKEIKPALSLYGMANEYMEKNSRANEYYRLRY